MKLSSSFIYILLIISVIASGMFIYAKFNSVDNTDNSINPKHKELALCQTDTDCSTGYSCDPTDVESTANSGGGISNSHTNTDRNTLTNAVISGICKVKEKGSCISSNECLASLSCILNSSNNSTSRTCEKTMLGSCDGPIDPKCTGDYQCREACGPPMAIENDTSKISYQCVTKEEASKPQNCPICLSYDTKISTPNGEINVQDIEKGDLIWSINNEGNKIQSKILKIAKTQVPINHTMISIKLSNGRNVKASPNHPLTNGLPIKDLKIGDNYDNSKVVFREEIPYTNAYTYDLLPDSDTGFYYANGILMGSTLK